MNAIFGRSGPLPRGTLDLLDRSAQYTPILRFVLLDREKRTYTAERWNFLGRIDDWIDIGRSGNIATLARNLIPVLGTDQFFELH